MISRGLYLIKNNIKPLIHLRESSFTSTPKKIFSGIQPTGDIHLGNYLGAIKQWVKLQEEGNDMTLCIVDLHAMTLSHDSTALSSNILKMTATLLASGLNPEKVKLFQQSTVPQHSELFWYLSCICTMARLSHLPQFKEKSKNLKNVPLALYTYPVLQAADILTYKATHVPVGEDQIQHLELTQELAKMFNKRFRNIFPIPKTLITESAKIKSLRDPSKKMSKSDPNVKASLFLTDSHVDIQLKLKKAVTDFTSEITYDPIIRPGISNMVVIHSAVTGKPINDIIEDAKGFNTAQYKSLVADELNLHIQPIRDRYIELLNNPKYLHDVLEEGRQKITPVAEETLQEVREILGIKFNIMQSNLSMKI